MHTICNGSDRPYEALRNTGHAGRARGRDGDVECYWQVCTVLYEQPAADSNPAAEFHARKLLYGIGEV